MRILAAAAICATAILLPVADAHAAAGDNASARGISADGVVNIPATPNAQCPGNGSPQDLASVSVPNVPVSASALHAECAGTTASAHAAQIVIGPDNDLVLTAAESSCNGATGSSTILDVNGNPTVANDIPLGDPSAIIVHLNEQTNDGGYLVVNAVHIVAFEGQPIQQDVIIGQSRCKIPNGVVPEAPMAVLLPLSTVLLFAAAYFVLRRRRPGETASS